MASYSNARWADAEHRNVLVDIDGKPWSVPVTHRFYADMTVQGVEIADYVTPAPEVPHEITAYQARIALLDAGLLDDIDAQMSSLEVAPAAKIAWEYATVWLRDSVFIAELAPALGLSGAQIDALFIAAAQVE